MTILWSEINKTGWLTTLSEDFQFFTPFLKSSRDLGSESSPKNVR